MMVLSKGESMSHRALLSSFVLITLMIACNMPGSMPAADATPMFATEAPTVAAPPTVAPTATLLPSDLAFTIDCSALEAARAADCETFLSTTRDKVYPILREVTGVSLSTCYDEIHYTITVDDPAAGAGGFADGANITFSQTYSVDLPEKYDVHELLHSASQCSGALDQHVLHGAVLNYVYARLGILTTGYFAQRVDAVELNDFLLEAVKTSSGSVLADQCRGILGNQMTIAYFDLDESAVAPLYRVTIDPKPVTVPNATLVAIWGSEDAAKVQALLEALERDFNYPLDVAACGY
jgi:hypothetical protein